MARTEDASGMVGFVQGRNGTGAVRNNAFDDVKVPVPKTSANTQVSRATEGGRMTRAKSRSNSQNLQSTRQNIPRTMQDTDATFTTTTAGSTGRAHSAGDNNRRPPKQVGTHDLPAEGYNPDDFESYSDEGEDDDEQDLPDRPPQAMQTAAAHRGVTHAHQVKPDGRNLGRISGDTYPDTTSGQPSTVHTEDRHEPQPAAYLQADSAKPAILPERGTGTRLSYDAQNMVRVPQSRNGQQVQPSPQQSTMLALPQSPEDVIKVINAGFKMPPNRPQSAQQPQQVSAQQLSNKPMPASTSHRQPAATRNQVVVEDIRRQEPTQPARPEPEYAATVAPQQNARRLQSENVRHFATAVPQHSRPPPQQQQFQQISEKQHHAQTIEAPESEMMSEYGDQNNNMPRGHSAQPQREAHEPEPLDYFPPQLHSMTFNELKTASFDHDPNAALPAKLSALQPGDPLAKQLDTLLTMDAQAKQEFFLSLGIEEWEEAGDWFLESFAKLTERFKIARREKRKIAQDFEHEVESRHESVSKKQKLTAGAMNEMKESGGKVLQGTPKKGPTLAK